jgi:hypothetical protein
MDMRPAIVRLLSLLIATSLVAEKETFAPANDVSFTISTDRKSYRTQEHITLKYRIVNVSNGPSDVPRGFNATACLDAHHAGPPYPGRI